MTRLTDLRAALLRYDGKDTSTLSSLNRDLRDLPDFVDRLAALADDPIGTVAAGATWLMRAELADGARLSASGTAELVGRLDAVTDWQARLHICQSIPNLDLPDEAREACASWLRSQLDSPRPFLRAWAGDALCNLLGPGPETSDVLDRLAGDPAASVRARARRIQAELGGI